MDPQFFAKHMAGQNTERRKTRSPNSATQQSKGVMKKNRVMSRSLRGEHYCHDHPMFYHE
jgi:hypothetical protein